MKSSILLAVYVLLTTLAAQSQQKTLPPALASLAEAERAFAKTCVEKGVAASFYEFFAEDGVNFQPGPVNTRTAFKSSLNAPKPPLTLNWAPIYGDVSQAGDLGYNTGPFLITDQSEQKRPPRHGVFFSVWQKQTDGNWKVVVDAGIRTPEAAAELSAPYQAAPPAQHATTRQPAKPSTDLNTERAALLQLDQTLFKAAATEGYSQTLLRHLSEHARLHRNGRLPLLGKTAIRAYLAGDASLAQGEPLKADVARSNDLGYTYGSYELRARQTAAMVEKGFYARVWRRNSAGQWEIVLDTTSPATPEQK